MVELKQVKDFLIDNMARDMTSSLSKTKAPSSNIYRYV